MTQEEQDRKAQEILDMPDPSKPPIPADRLVVPNDGDNDDISGHESLTRVAKNRLEIDKEGGNWIIESESPITVYRKD